MSDRDDDIGAECRAALGELISAGPCSCSVGEVCEAHRRALVIGDQWCLERDLLRRALPFVQAACTNTPTGHLSGEIALALAREEQPS